MAKKSKLSTPAWILEGREKPKEEKKENTFKIKECPKCRSDDVGVVLSNSDAEEGGGKGWECRKCKWKGREVIEKELSEEEFMKYLDDKGVDVS